MNIDMGVRQMRFVRTRAATTEPALPMQARTAAGSSSSGTPAAGTSEDDLVRGLVTEPPDLAGAPQVGQWVGVVVLALTVGAAALVVPPLIFSDDPTSPSPSGLRADGPQALPAPAPSSGTTSTPPGTTVDPGDDTAGNPLPRPGEDPQFVVKGQCVRNEGTTALPVMRIVACASGTFEVLKRVDGRTTGEADAEVKCAKVADYTKWYFYDSELDNLDFVLCLREHNKG